MICAPALLYLVISVIFLIYLFVQNVGNTDIYCYGNGQCSVANTPLLFLLKAIVIAVWTWILNIICYAGYSWVSWALVLLPFFIYILLVLSLVI